MERQLVRSLANWLGEWIRQRISGTHGQIVAVIILAYIGSLGVWIWLRSEGLIDENWLASLTVSSSCVAFLFAQLAFAARTRHLERHLMIDRAVLDLTLETNSREDHVGLYISIGVSGASIIRDLGNGNPYVRQAVLDLSWVALDTCRSELTEMSTNKRIQRSGDDAWRLTHRCYQFATRSVQAIALATDESIRFWMNHDGIGEHFYDSNSAAARRGVSVSRFFVFDEDHFERLRADDAYRSELEMALDKYMERLPKSKLVIVCYDHDWREHYPVHNVGNQELANSNKKFRGFFTEYFPDVSIFDDDVASLWSGASDRQISSVRIAWENHHVSRVRMVFSGLLSPHSCHQKELRKRSTLRQDIAQFLMKAPVS